MNKFLIPLLALFFSQFAAAKVLIEDGSTRPRTIVKTASDAVSLRALRRVGVGLSAQGPLGSFGANLELNFSPKWSFLTGFGGGTGYQAFTVQAKKVLSGTTMLPYFGFGYSRWYTPGEEPVDKADPKLIYDRFASPKERAERLFDIHLIYPLVGIQYMQLNGNWAGFSVFAEAMMLVQVDDFANAPTGTLGVSYYF